MSKLAGLFLAAALVAPSVASAVVIDFDGLDSTSGQTVPLATIVEDGYTFSLTSSGSANLGPAIFNTLCTGYGGSDGCNGDGDLVPANQVLDVIFQNVLILQEVGGAVTPNDAAGGGTITFTLEEGTPFRLTGFSAVDDETFSISTVADGLLGVIANTNENQVATVGFLSSVIGIGESFTITYEGSGGIDSIGVQPIPLPASMLLLLPALAGLGWVGRRRKTVAA